MFSLQTEEDEEEEEAEPIYQNQGQILIAQQQLDQQQQQLDQQQQQLDQQQQQLLLQQQQQLVPGQEPIYQNLPLHEKLNQSYTGEEEEEEEEENILIGTGATTFCLLFPIGIYRYIIYFFFRPHCGGSEQPGWQYPY